MGGYIAISFVFRPDKLKLKEKMLRFLLDSLGLNDHSVILHNDKQILYKDMTENVYRKITEEDYSNLFLLCDFLNIKNQMLNIVYCKETTHFSFQFNLFVNKYKKTDYSLLEQDITDYIISCYTYLPFAYAVCENDGEVLFSPDELDDEEFSYSIMVLPDNGSLTIKKGGYNIDGSLRG